MHKLYHGDCLEFLRNTKQRYACVFADPPDNTGMKYDGFTDSSSGRDYHLQLYEWARRFVEIADTTWISFNAKWIVEMTYSVDSLLLQPRSCANKGLSARLFVQPYTFGQHNSRDFGGGFRPLYRLKWEHASVYPDQIRVKSERQRMRDKRADPRGKVPSDVFDFPRVTGNSKQRRSWHPTQLHEGLVERCILSCTQPGDVVLDPFAGTGTVLRVCKAIDRVSHSIECSKEYVKRIAEEHGLDLT